MWCKVLDWLVGGRCYLILDNGDGDVGEGPLSVEMVWLPVRRQRYSRTAGLIMFAAAVMVLDVRRMAGFILL